MNDKYPHIRTVVIGDAAYRYLVLGKGNARPMSDDELRRLRDVLNADFAKRADGGGAATLRQVDHIDGDWPWLVEHESLDDPEFIGPQPSDVTDRQLVSAVRAHLDADPCTFVIHRRDPAASGEWSSVPPEHGERHVGPWVVKLQLTGECWINNVDNSDPGRTCKLENAERFDTYVAATDALARARKWRPFAGASIDKVPS